jgi:hypothetical protein
MGDLVRQPRFLFRYRDLVADTLPEHRKIIDGKGWCWWGWWKRPNEPGRLEVWRTIADETRNGPVRVGLFHSGSGEVHFASVEQVILPEEDEYGQYSAVTPSSNELEHIPAYYRNSRHSRGWLRIRSISKGPVEFFGKYSYAESPPLPQYSAGQLVRLVGKQIIDADELRSMDTTIWEVRPSEPEDSTERFLIANIANTGNEAPLSAHPIACPGEWLLHITDPHYSTGKFRSQHQWRLEGEPISVVPTMVDAINVALVEYDRSVGAVIVSGDLTYIGSEEEFNAARAGLFKLVNGLLGLGLEHLVVIPGNHDVVWTRNDEYVYGAEVEVAPDMATANYRAFFQKLFSFPASTHLSMARRFVFPGGNLVDVVAVNSSSLEQGKHFLAGMGRVQEAGYQAAATTLSWEKQHALGLRILTLHHHLALTEDLESSDEYGTGFGIAIDAPRIQRMAAKHGVHLAVHGHKHRAFVWRANAYELPEYAKEKWELGAFNIVGGGSSGSTSTDGQRNFFNLFRIAGTCVELEIFGNSHGGKFERISTWQAQLVRGTDRDGLCIGPWQKVLR